MVFDALRYEEIDLYPEYTGTAYLVLLNRKPEDISDFNNPDSVLKEVDHSLNMLHQIEVLPTLGFNNTFAIMMRRQHADSLGISSVSDLSKYLRNDQN